MPPKSAKTLFEAAKLRRDRVLKTLEAMWDAMRNLSEFELDVIEAHYQELPDFKSQFQDASEALEEAMSQLPVEEHEPYMEDQIRFSQLVIKVRALYLSIKRDVELNRPSVETTALNQSRISNPDVRLMLPKIELPSFSGQMETWPEFIALYDSLVHNEPSLEPTQKLKYLRNSLKGEAAATISGFQLTADNYTLAYQALTTRYQNDRRIASLYLQAILEYKRSNTCSLSSLREFVNIHRTNVNALIALPLEDLLDFILMSLSLRNLDPLTRRAFESQCLTSEVPRFDDLLQFATKRLTALQNSELFSHSITTTRPIRGRPSNVLLCNREPPTPSINVQTRSCCLHCQGQHSIYRCSKYQDLSPDRRFAFVVKSRLCINCLGVHAFTACRSKFGCSLCRSREPHTTLHHASRSRTPSKVSEPIASTSKSVPSSLFVEDGSVSTRQVLLGTLTVMVAHKSRGQIPFRAVLDSGSQISIISLQAVRELGLSMTPVQKSASGLGQAAVAPLGLVHLTISSRSGNTHIPLEATVLKDISNPLPAMALTAQVADQYRHLTLADDRFDVPSSVDFLLGADVYLKVIIPEPPIEFPGHPSAVPSRFGWLIFGPDTSISVIKHRSTLLCNQDLSAQVRKFWETEEVHVEVPRNPLDEIAERHFISTHYRQPDGRYVVSLPFKPDSSLTTHNYHRSYQALLRMENRLKKSSLDHGDYYRFMNEYANMGHMSLATSRSSYILPHHIVRKGSGSECRIRVVFDGSYQDTTGPSLNSCLLVGPKQQADLALLLTNFRLHPIALCVDIEKMYRQILIHPSDRPFQHILWRPSAQADIQEYELNTVTYGLACSPFLALRVLKQLIIDEGPSETLASKAVRNNTYIDDIIVSVADVTTAITLQRQLNVLLGRGGFPLRKWASNNRSVLQSLPSDHIADSCSFSDDSKSVSILGLRWIPARDVFVFDVQPFSGAVTKRTVLSYISRIFDPLGFLAPVTFLLKVFLQTLWSYHLNWDEVFPPSLTCEWTNLVHSITALSKWEIPRPISSIIPIQLNLIGFCDASERGFAAVLYLQYQLSPDDFVPLLLKAKTRVAPLKVLSIPRLELNAAVLLAHLVKSVLPLDTRVPLSLVRLYSDSQNVLNWLKTPPHLLKTYVANRVVCIHDTVSDASWAYINTTINPADAPSRGLNTNLFLEPVYQSLWLRGPSFLTQFSALWPSTQSSNFQSSEEFKTIVLLTPQDAPTSEQFLVVLNRYSSLTRAIRVFAWIRRFISKCRRDMPDPLPAGSLTCVELASATLDIVRLTQEQFFSREIAELNKGTLKSPSLQSLSPFLDSNGIIRVGGRLRNADLPFDTKHPFLIPKEAPLARLICQHYHVLGLHAGPSTTLYLIRQKYWILSMRRLVRKVVRCCTTCTKFRASTYQPVMADLPTSRVTETRPFSRVGVDFAGPFVVKESRLRKARTSKGYLCLFVCFTTKAVHLEFVSDLSTPGFMAALQRFVSRRGLPSTLYSDNGRNFVGAARALREVSNFLKNNQTSICIQSASLNIDWKFNPPYTPHFGGLWEAAVKSAKRLLVRLLGDTPATAEEYATIFSRIEAVLNSRPLSPLSSDPAEIPRTLSPGHFLVGGPLLTLPEKSFSDDQPPPTRWERHSQKIQSFWHRWSHEYLNTLMQRRKWIVSSRLPKVGDIVFLKNLTTSVATWPLGRIISLSSGSDKLPRVAAVKTTSGVVQRSVSSLIPLFDEDQSADHV